MILMKILNIFRDNYNNSLIFTTNIRIMKVAQFFSKSGSRFYHKIDKNEYIHAFIYFKKVGCKFGNRLINDNVKL